MFPHLSIALLDINRKQVNTLFMFFYSDSTFVVN